MYLHAQMSLLQARIERTERMMRRCEARMQEASRQPIHKKAPEQRPEAPKINCCKHYQTTGNYN